jgi:CheY-like chemotaxis protein
MIVENNSGAESEVSHQAGRGSPDPNAVALANLRYPPQIRPSSSISGRNTPPGEYPNRMRQYTQGSKQVLAPTSAPGQAASFQMQLPAQTLPTIPQKAQSPLGGPSNHPQSRLSQGAVPTRPVITSIPSAIPISANEKSQPTQKGATSPKSPGSGNSSNSGANTNSSPVTRRKSNTISQQGLPLIQKPRSPSPVDERKESPLPPRGVPLVKPKTEKDALTGPNKNSAIGVIPPINVLIVEDNFINAQILEVFFRKRKLKYATAVNGKEAVEKWRQGGWHLVLVFLPSVFVNIRWIFNSLSYQVLKQPRKSVDSKELTISAYSLKKQPINHPLKMNSGTYLFLHQ